MCLNFKFKLNNLIKGTLILRGAVGVFRLSGFLNFHKMSRPANRPGRIRDKRQRKANTSRVGQRFEKHNHAKIMVIFFLK